MNCNEEFAVNLVHPYRLVFTAQEGETNLDEDTYTNIKFIKIEEVTDYHGKRKRK